MTTKEELDVFKDFQQFANVVEPWSIFDTILICNTYYGAETNVQGWFTSFALFGQQETHSFFKTRTEGNAGSAYTNQQSADNLDFAFIAHSMGLAVMAPAPNIEGTSTDQQEGNQDTLGLSDSLIGHFFSTDLPNHIGLQLKVQQDIRAEGNAYHFPPGYGATGHGTAFQLQADASGAAFGDVPFMTNAVTQGVPVLDCRFPFPDPIGIPRTATIEGIMYLSEYARNVMTNVTGPQDFWFNSDDGQPPFMFFPKRYMIQMSLFGERLVQQRGQYHR